MSATLVPPLRRAMVSIFEDLAMILANEPDPVSPPEEGFAYAVRVAFSGSHSGYVELRATRAATVATAGNMLAEDEPSEELLGDALGEIANVLCGNLLTGLDGRETVFRLEPPARISPQWPATDDARSALQLESGQAEARLVVTDGSAESWGQRSGARGRRAADGRG